MGNRLVSKEHPLSDHGDRPRRPIRVLFVHGLESQPNGSKTRILREQGFEVTAPDMHMGLFKIERRNSALRQALRLDETRAVMVSTLGLLGLSIHRRSLSAALLGVSLVSLWGFTRRRAVFAKAFGKSFDACLAIVRAELRASEVDVVVGSSFGGAIAAQLVVEGDWKGPTVLLAPAVRLIRVESGRSDEGEIAQSLREKSREQPVVIFHDPTDDVVPFADSENLARGSAIDLRSVDAGGHRLLKLLERGELRETLEELAVS